MVHRQLGGRRQLRHPSASVIGRITEVICNSDGSQEYLRPASARGSTTSVTGCTTRRTIPQCDHRGRVDERDSTPMAIIEPYLVRSRRVLRQQLAGPWLACAIFAVGCGSEAPPWSPFPQLPDAGWNPFPPRAGGETAAVMQDDAPPPEADGGRTGSAGALAPDGVASAGAQPAQPADEGGASSAPRSTDAPPVAGRRSAGRAGRSGESIWDALLPRLAGRGADRGSSGVGAGEATAGREAAADSGTTAGSAAPNSDLSDAGGEDLDASGPGV
jgi:hypothetical protein